MEYRLKLKLYNFSVLKCIIAFAIAEKICYNEVKSIERSEKMTSTVKCLSPAEAAKLIGIGRTKFYALLKENQIPHIRIGHRILIPVKELENWIHQQAIKNQKIGKE